MNAKTDSIDLKIKLDESLIILKEYQLNLRRFLSENHIPERTIASILESIFKYLIQTIEILQALMLRDKPMYKQSAILSRSIFEFSIRVAWAARMKNGWMRYQAYWIKEDKKWADEAKNDDKLFELANRKLKEFLLIIKKIGVDAKLPMPSSMKQVLKDIWQTDLQDGYLKPEQMDFSLFIYTNVYRPLSRYVHGNAFIFQTPDESLFRFVSGVAVDSTFYICMAFLYSVYDSPKTEIEKLCGRIVPIFTGVKSE